VLGVRDDPIRRSWPDRRELRLTRASVGPAACRAGDTLVVTKLERLARSLPDARNILHELTRRNVKLSLGGSIPTQPIRWPANGQS
jgi:Resolvase, N terminal domain